MELKFLVAIILISATANVTIGAGLGIPIEVEASKMSDADRYDSGYGHGCSDAQIDDPKDWYINGVNKNGEPTNKAHHTAAFNAGYDAGFQACGGQIVNVDEIITKTNTEINEQEQNQAASTHQNGSCGTILIGDCYIGQNSENTFAANAEN
jgi:hypothetical protein